MSAPDLNKVVVSGVIDDISTAGQIYIPIPVGFDGTILQLVATLNSAISVADATLTLKNSDGTTIGTLVVPYDGSAAGDTVTVDLNGLCRPDAAIEVETDGGSTTAAKCYVSVVIKR